MYKSKEEKCIVRNFYWGIMRWLEVTSHIEFPTICRTSCPLWALSSLPLRKAPPTTDRQSTRATKPGMYLHYCRKQNRQNLLYFDSLP